MRRTRIRVIAAVLLACCGCNSYVTLAAEPSSVGADVRVTLTDTGALVVSPQVGGAAREVDGHLRAVTDTSLVIAVGQVIRLSGVEDQWNGESVSVPRTAVATLERKMTSIGKSVAIGIAIVGGAFLVGRSLGSGQATGSTTPGPGQGSGQ